MASKFLRRQKWWIKFRHPATGQTIRESLETENEIRAELLRERLELQVALLDPRFQAVEIPARLRPKLAWPDSTPASPVQVSIAPKVAPVSPAPIATRCSVDEAITTYLRFIASENAALHVANKVSMLRRFVGANRVEKAGGPAKTKRRRLENGKVLLDPPAFFTGTFLDEITPAVVQEFLEGLGVGRKTMRHYREMFHHFFEVCLKFDLYHPTNWHRPNPMSALPGYASRNRRIVFLSQPQIEEQVAVLADDRGIQMAATLMIYAGLRRAETLWLTRDSIAADLSYLSVLNRRDEESDIESTLKTGERTVTILPPLRAALEKYLPLLDGPWIVPNTSGGRWRPDCFSTRLRALNAKAGLTWTCLPYRHTYATQRAAQGWSLFQISKEMGNSAAVVEEYYAGYIRPVQIAHEP